MLGDNNLNLFTKEVGQSYQQIDIDTLGELPKIDMSIKWPSGERIPLTTPLRVETKRKLRNPSYLPTPPWITIQNMLG